MPNKLILTTLAVLISIFMAIPAAAADQPVTVYWNDREVRFDAAPVVEDGRCLAPLRPLAGAMGAELYWDRQAGAATVSLAGVALTVTPGSPTAVVNGREVSLPAAPALRDGELFVPLRAAAGIFNVSVDWDETSRSAFLYPNSNDLVYGSDRETVHQISILSALLEGQYDGITSFAELKKYGDTGIGTFEGLDGEMVELDGEFYQVKADGAVYPVAGDMKTPFACVTFFQGDKAQAINEETDFRQLQELIDSMIDNENIFYAVKVTGSFKYVKTRSVPGQQKPYPPLAEVTKYQPTFELSDTEGTLVGFLCPVYVEGLNVPGYHLHFLNAAKNAGGHLLDFIMTGGEVEIDATPNFYMRLPEGGDFGEIDMTQDRSQETNIVEK